MSLNKTLIATITAAFFTGSLYLTEGVRQQSLSQLTPQQVVASQSELTKFAVSQHVDYGNSKNETHFTEAQKGDTALKFLQSKFSITSKTYPFGTSVESISGVKNGTGNKYWIYYINGQSAQVGADQYVLKPGDIITWKFEFAN